ncbi:hypothetical protein MHYP_G00004250 [Metynnis hypsauchen]
MQSHSSSASPSCSYCAQPASTTEPVPPSSAAETAPVAFAADQVLNLGSAVTRLNPDIVFVPDPEPGSVLSFVLIQVICSSTWSHSLPQSYPFLCQLLIQVLPPFYISLLDSAVDVPVWF